MRYGEATGDYGVPGDVLGEGNYRLTTKRINNLYETGEWPKFITEVTMATLKKEPEESKFRNHPTVSLSAHTTETEETILGTRFDDKIKDVLAEDQFGFRS
jgi:hypothetical protein